MLMNRRGILGGLASMLAAPAIVHAGNLMPVKVMQWQGVPIQNWDGAFMFAPSDKLVQYTEEIMREFVRTNLFSPYLEAQPPWERL